ATKPRKVNPRRAPWHRFGDFFKPHILRKKVSAGAGPELDVAGFVRGTAGRAFGATLLLGAAVTLAVGAGTATALGIGTGIAAETCAGIAFRVSTAGVRPI